ncbi:hypothetical protein HQ585_08310 [candidate division KSB1 bacterium]|nr:hypothetical protein [candidate division KSB1 bacterium]
MKERLLIITVLAVLFANAVHSDVTTLAVLDFDNNSIFNVETYSSLSRGLSQMMISALDPIQSVDVVERQKFSDLIDEIKMAQSGLGSDAVLQRIGQMSGAKHLVFGSFMVTPDDKIRIDVRLVEVETGKTVKAEEVTGKSKKILELVDKLSLKFVQNLKLELSNNEKALLNKSVDVPMQALVAYSEGLLFEDNKKDKDAYLAYQKALKIAPKFDEAKSKLKALVERVKNK